MLIYTIFIAGHIVFRWSHIIIDKTELNSKPLTNIVLKIQKILFWLILVLWLEVRTGYFSEIPRQQYTPTEITKRRIVSIKNPPTAMQRNVLNFCDNLSHSTFKRSRQVVLNTREYFIVWIAHLFTPIQFIR